MREGGIRRCRDSIRVAHCIGKSCRRMELETLSDKFTIVSGRAQLPRYTRGGFYKMSGRACRRKSRVKSNRSAAKGKLRCTRRNRLHAVALSLSLFFAHAHGELFTAVVSSRSSSFRKIKLNSRYGWTADGEGEGSASAFLINRTVERGRV